MTTTLQTTGTREIQFREAINECLRQEMERDDTVITVSYTHLTLPTSDLV